MTDESKIVLVKSMTDEKAEDIISVFLEMAGDSVCKYCDPYKRVERETLLEEYGGVQARIAAYFLNKRGADGESAHSENGTSRSYESGDIPESLLRELTPICGVTS
jgi:hypothetical protein